MSLTWLPAAVKLCRTISNTSQGFQKQIFFWLDMNNSQKTIFGDHYSCHTITGKWKSSPLAFILFVRVSTMPELILNQEFIHYSRANVHLYATPKESACYQWAICSPAWETWISCKFSWLYHNAYQILCGNKSSFIYYLCHQSLSPQPARVVRPKKVLQMGSKATIHNSYFWSSCIFYYSPKVAYLSRLYHNIIRI